MPAASKTKNEKASTENLFRRSKRTAQMEDDIAASKMAERKDMLILAQQKMDEMSRTNLGLSGGGRRGSASSKHQRKGSAVSSHLLSTLLYVALMAHKLEDMKTMLEEEDGDVYEEWRTLLENLHSPEFHTKERSLQNQRVKRTFERKRRYKEEATRLQEELTGATNQLTELQTLSNETNNEMSKTINTLQEERAALVSKDEERQYQTEELREKIAELQREAEANGEKLQSLQLDVEGRDRELEEKNQSLAELEKQMSQYKQDAAVAIERADHAQTTLDEKKAQLEASESIYTNYRTEKEAVVAKLQQDLSVVSSTNAVLDTKLAAANEALDVAKRNSEDGLKQSIAATSASFDEIKSQSDALKDIVCTGITKLDANITRQAESQSLSISKLEDKISSNKELHERSSVQIKQSLLDVKQRLLNDGRSSELQEQSEDDGLCDELVKIQQKLDELLSERQNNTLQHEVSLNNAPQPQNQQQREVVSQESSGSESAVLETQPWPRHNFDGMNVQLLQNISLGINGVCDKIARLEHTKNKYLQSGCSEDKLLDSICSTIGAVSDQCVAIKSDVQTAVEGRSDGHLSDSTPRSVSTNASSHHSTADLVAGGGETQTRNWTADDIVDNSVSEAVSRCHDARIQSR